MAEKIRVGIIGASVTAGMTDGGGGWAGRAHIPALQALPDYEIRAVCTAHEESAKASAAAFGAELAFHDARDLVAHPDIDLVVVSLRVPSHRDVVMQALAAGKDTFCEWPLGANLAEAEEMASAAHQRGVRTMVGLQARSAPEILYAHELIQQGRIGEILAVNLTVFAAALVERPADHVWYGDRRAGANTLTITGGHNIDTLCFLAGEFAEVSGRLATQVKQWRNTETGASVDVDAPDSVSFIGRLQNGAEASVNVVSLPSGQGGVNLTVFGSEGSLHIGSAIMTNLGPNVLSIGHGSAAPEETAVPDRFKLAPEGTPAGFSMNVAQAYARFFDARAQDRPFEIDFDLAVQRHRLLDAVERSSRDGKTVQLA